MGFPFLAERVRFELTKVLRLCRFQVREFARTHIAVARKGMTGRDVKFRPKATIPAISRSLCISGVARRQSLPVSCDWRLYLPRFEEHPRFPVLQYPSETFAWYWSRRLWGGPPRSFGLSIHSQSVDDRADSCRRACALANLDEADAPATHPPVRAHTLRSAALVLSRRRQRIRGRDGQCSRAARQSQRRCSARRLCRNR
jgi:hypothetical protein